MISFCYFKVEMSDCTGRTNRIDVMKRIAYTAVTFIGCYVSGRMLEENFQQPERQTPLNWFLAFATVGVNLMLLWNLFHHATIGKDAKKLLRRSPKQVFGITGV